MKTLKLYRLLLAVLCIGSVTSCSESAFNRIPSDNFTEDMFFSDAQSVEQMLTDAYASLRGEYQYYYYVADIPSDDSYNNKFNNTFDLITINEANTTATNSGLSNLWINSYAVISRAHLVMEKAETVSKIDATLKARFVNEAKFMRALTYFNLVRVFGDVPLVLKDIKVSSELFEYSREPKQKVYEQIIADLKDAEALPAAYTNNKDIGRATSVAAKALLAKVYLTMGDYPSAKSILEQVIFSTEHHHQLMTNYNDVFDPDKPNNDEIVFAVQYARGFDPTMGNPIVNGAFPNEDLGGSFGSGILKRGTGTFLMTSDLYRSFDADDKRLGMTCQMTGTRGLYIFTLKYYDFGMISKVDSGCDWIVLRWADVLLMYAEALNATGATASAYLYLEQVRTRAGLTTDEKLKNDNAVMASAIENERRLELFCEGQRWFDLVRTGRAINVMNAHFKDITQTDNEIGSGNKMEEYKLLFPIPANQVDLNPTKIKQNPGY